MRMVRRLARSQHQEQPSPVWGLHFLPQSVASIIPLTEYSIEAIFVT
jgi:hypothetical protein